MKFLIDEDLPRSTAALLQRYGHISTDVRDTELHGVKDPQIALYAQNQGLCLLTGDFGFADIRNYPPARYSGIVIIGVKGNANAATILKILEEFLKREKLVDETKGRLVIVEAGRVRVRK